MLKLPNETLDIIFRSTSRVDLLTLCLVNKRCRDIVERIIYAKIQHIQLFPNTLSNPAHMGCLTVLATSPKPARSLRHFAIQGVPWQSEATFNSITRALLNATCLQSLDLDLGESAEPAFLPESLSASRAVLPFLNAISVTSAEMAGALVPHRPVESVRIAGAATDRSFVQVLPRLAMGTVPVKHFQAAIEGKSHHDIVLAAKGVAYYIPEVVSLCLDFRGLPGKTENHAALIADVARVLGRLPQLAHLALALPTTERGSLSDVLVISRHCTGVSRIELQWNSWSCASGQWKPDPAKQWYALMRRRWAYEHAK